MKNRVQFGHYHGFPVDMSDEEIIRTLAYQLIDLLAPITTTELINSVELDTLHIIFKHMDNMQSDPLGIEGQTKQKYKATLGIKYWAEVPEERKNADNS